LTGRCFVCDRPATRDLDAVEEGLGMSRCDDPACERVWSSYLRENAAAWKLERRGRHAKAARIRERAYRRYARHRDRVAEAA
jgi:hypothetical protein